MALTQQLDTEFGFSLPDSYHRISQVYWYGHGLELDVRVSVYASQDARRQNAQPLRTSSYLVPLDLESPLNWIAQAYEYLKTHPDYEGAEDA